MRNDNRTPSRKKKRDFQGVLPVLALMLLSFGITGCDSDVVGNPPAEEDPWTPNHDFGVGIHPVLSIPGWSKDMGPALLQLQLHLLAVGVPDGVGNFQGELRYDPEVVELLSGSVPPGILGAWNPISEGTVRFAGVSLEGLDTLGVLTLNVRSSRTLKPTDFVVWLDKVSATKRFESLDHFIAEEPNPTILPNGIRGGPANQ